MRKKVTTKFFKVLRHELSDPRMTDTLQIIKSGLDAGADIEKDLGREYHCKIERLEIKDTVWTGEISRVQKSNFPYEVTKAGPQELQTKNNLGHGISFLFDVTTSCLAMQVDTRVVAPSRLLEYLNEFNKSTLRLVPVLRKDAMDNFGDLPLRKIELSVASPVSFDSGNNSHLSRSIRSMGDAYQGASVSITISMGREKGALSGVLNNLMPDILSRNATVSRAKVTTSLPASDPDHVIDLIAELLSEEEELNIEDRNPDKRYKECIKFVERSYLKNRSYLSQYSANA